ncbi:MAG: hypothetical protein ACE5I4_00645 [Thermoplasmata archaeon]
MMQRDFGIFIEDVDPVDLRVEEGKVPTLDGRLKGDYVFGEYTFDESTFVVKTPSGRVQLEEGLIRARSVAPHELFRWVTAEMRRHLMEKEVLVLHAAAVARDGLAHIFPAWAQTGKTNLLLNLVSHGYGYMADDWCPVSVSGEVLAYPRGLALFEYNFDCYPELVEALGDGKEGRVFRRQLAGTKFARSLDGSNRLSRSLKRWMLKRFFVYGYMPVSELIPGSRITRRASLAEVCLLTTKSGESLISQVSPRYLARKVALANQVEWFPFTRYKVAREYAGLQRMSEHLVSKEEEILTRIFSKAKCTALTLSPYATGEEMDRIRRMWEEA